MRRLISFCPPSICRVGLLGKAITVKEHTLLSSDLFQELPYFPDSSRYFALFAQQPWAVYLDSVHPYGGAGRYDILAADPTVTLVTRGDLTEIESRGERIVSSEDPFDLIRGELGPLVPAREGVPFSGGALGYFGYDLARRIERLPCLARDETGLPEMAVGLYDWAVVVDHHRQSSWLVGQGRDPATRRGWNRLLRLLHRAPASSPKGDFKLGGAVETNLDPAAYAAAFHRVRHYIHEGDCYQVNLAQRFAVGAQGDPWSLYLALRQANPAPFSAFLRLPWATVLSSSPERFLRVSGGQVETCPIKGTRSRGETPQEDLEQIRLLQSSEKDRAENLMIVDLLRNDLGRSCSPGSVRVKCMFKVESFARVHHLVSTITGSLAPGREALGLLRACFPGGSITGAPKIRAMQIIEELEPCRRGVYCGAIGYIGCDGNMDANIAIRTLTHSDDTLRFWAGGGIVADSTVDVEYQETLDKAAAVLDLLQRLR